VSRDDDRPGSTGRRFAICRTVEGSTRLVFVARGLIGGNQWYCRSCLAVGDEWPVRAAL